VVALKTHFNDAETLRQRADPSFPGTFNLLSRHEGSIISTLNLLVSLKCNLEIEIATLERELASLRPLPNTLDKEQPTYLASVRKRRYTARLRRRGFQTLVGMAATFAKKLGMRLAQCGEVIGIGRQLGLGTWRNGWAQRIWGARYELIDASSELRKAGDWIEEIMLKTGIELGGEEEASSEETDQSQDSNVEAY
jgi:hypothetical protein